MFLVLVAHSEGVRGPGIPQRRRKKEINVTVIEVIQEICKKRKLDLIL